MLTVLYWLSRWPFIGGVISFFVFAQMLPPFTGYLRTPLLLGASFLVLAILSAVRLGVRGRLEERAVIEGTWRPPGDF